MRAPKQLLCQKASSLSHHDSSTLRYPRTLVSLARQVPGDYQKLYSSLYLFASAYLFTSICILIKLYRILINLLIFK